MKLTTRKFLQHKKNQTKNNLKWNVPSQYRVQCVSKTFLLNKVHIELNKHQITNNFNFDFPV